MKATDATDSMLRAVYLSARNGCEAISGIVPQIKDKALMTETSTQLEMYGALSARAESMLTARSAEIPKLSLGNRLAVRGSILFETMGNTVQSEIAQILRDSFCSSAVRMRSAIDAHSESGCDADALALAGRIMAFEMAEAEKLSDMQSTYAK